MHKLQLLVLVAVHQPLLHDLDLGRRGVLAPRFPRVKARTHLVERWTVPERPMLKPWYRLAWDGPRLLLDYAQSLVAFEGSAVTELLPRLLPLLDGAHTIEEIVGALGEPAAPAVHNALRLMGRHGVLSDGPAPCGDGRDEAIETARFLVATTGRDWPVAQVAERVAAADVAVAGSGAIAEEVGRALRLAGVRHVTKLELDPSVDGGLPDLAIAAPAGSELPALAKWNRHALATGLVWLQALPFDGRYAALGPLFVPGDTCCYECFRIRRASNSGYAAELDVLDDVPAFYPASAPFSRALASIVACSALRWLVGRDALLPGVLYTFEWRDGASLRGHHVYRVPRCPACSDAVDQAPPMPWFEGELPR